MFPLHADTSELTHTFRNLKPVTRYSVTVMAENGVSYLDGRVEMRKVEVENTTAEGRMLLLYPQGYAFTYTHNNMAGIHMTCV